MKTGTTRGPWLSLVLLGLGVGLAPRGLEAAEAEIRFEVLLGRSLATGGHVLEPVAFSLDQAGAQALQERAGRLPAFSTRRDSLLLRVHRLLQDEAVQAGIRRAIRPAGVERIRYLFNPTDTEASLRAGERLVAWDPQSGGLGEIEVEAGDILATLAARLYDDAVRVGQLPDGLSDTDRLEAMRILEQHLRAANPLRFDVWPQATSLGQGTTRERVIAMGESGAAGVPNADLRAMLVHEAGHIGDLSTCGSVGDGYGPRPGHTLEEIMTPHAALVEGWAQYQSYEFRQDGGRFLTETILDRDLYHDTSGHVVQRVPAQDLEVWDLISNEAYVARLLKLLAAEIGRDAVEETFERTFGDDCGDVLTLLREVGVRFPGVQLAPVLARAFDLRGEDLYAAILAGERPPWYSPVRLLRLRSSAFARQPPQRDLPAPTSLGGAPLFGMP